VDRRSKGPSTVRFDAEFSLNVAFAQAVLILTITDLSAPVDVYAEWIDACDALAHDTAAAAAPPASSQHLQSRLPTQSAGRAGLAPGEKYDTGDGFIDDDDADGEADYNDDDD
jgi:transcription elongation factor Elf1